MQQNDETLFHLVEFLGVALGPSFEVVLFELEDDNTGTLKQIEMSFITSMKQGDALPEDIVRVLNANNIAVNTYITGLTAVVGKSKLCNLSLLFIKRRPAQKNCLLAILWDSTEYYNMAMNLLSMSNLNNKIDIPKSPIQAIMPVKNENIINIPLVSSEEDQEAESASRVDGVLAEIEAVVVDVMGDRSHQQPAFTQEKRLEIVKILNEKKIFAIKGMVKEVSARLFCSSATVYRYLSSLE